MSNSKQSCLICNGTKLEKFLKISSITLRKPYPVATCKDCGHIQMFPIPDEKDIIKFNNTHFGKSYQPEEGFKNEAKKKAAKLMDHISGYLKEGLNVLDVGPGEGWALELVKEHSSSYFAIESVDTLAVSISKRGGTIIAKTIYDLDKTDIKFDIIIFRMVIEHLANPTRALELMRNSLVKNGIIYCICPNSKDFTPKAGFVTDFLRPMHISYFCIENVGRLFESVNLKILDQNDEKEIMVIATRTEHISSKYLNMYKSQKARFLKMKKKYRYIDSKRKLKIFLKKYLGKIGV